MKSEGRQKTTGEREKSEGREKEQLVVDCRWMRRDGDVFW